MTSPADDPTVDRDDFRRAFDAEVRRLRLNPLRLGGIAASGQAPARWQDALLARMRRLAPGARWTDVFPDARPGAFEPDAKSPIAALVAEVDADPDRWWREHDEREAVMRELDRVVPGELRRATVPGASWGIIFPHGQAHALRVLRQLPDRAGTEAVAAALVATPEARSRS